MSTSSGVQKKCTVQFATRNFTQTNHTFCKRQLGTVILTSDKKNEEIMKTRKTSQKSILSNHQFVLALFFAKLNFKFIFSALHSVHHWPQFFTRMPATMCYHNPQMKRDVSTAAIECQRCVHRLIHSLA